MVSPPGLSSLNLQELIRCVEVSWPRGHTISLFHKAHTLSISAFSFTFSLALPFPVLFVAYSPRLSLWDLYHIPLCSCLRLCPISSSLAGPCSPPMAPCKSQSFPHRTATAITVSPCLTLGSSLSSFSFPGFGSGRFPWVLEMISDICHTRYAWSVLEDNPKEEQSPPAGALPVSLPRMHSDFPKMDRVWVDFYRQGKSLMKATPSFYLVSDSKWWEC